MVDCVCDTMLVVGQLHWDHEPASVVRFVRAKTLRQVTAPLTAKLALCIRKAR
jgi:hypothetical protein